MPLMKYFGFVGSALVLLLLVMNWALPEPANEPVRGSVERPVIRISSIETLPERVVFDTSLPYVAPPPSATRVAVQLPQSAFAFEQITPGVLPTLSTVARATVARETVAQSTVAQLVPKKPNAAKRDPAKKLANYRAAPQAQTPAARSYPVREAEQNVTPPIKTSFLYDIAGRLGQLFKVN
jgi:hypothetical protein